MSGPGQAGALRGAGIGAAAGAGLLTFLLFAAGDRAAPASGAEAAWCYAGFTGLSALLGAWLGRLQAAQLARPLPRTAGEAMAREGAAGLRMGFVFGLLYAAAALGIFLRTALPLWLLALRAGLALLASTLLMGAAGCLIGLLKARSAR